MHSLARQVFHSRYEFRIIGRDLDGDGVVAIPLRPNVNAKGNYDRF
jgi:hypothetical protein